MAASTVLVTGANRGLGFAVCQSLLQNGHRVIGTARKVENGASWRHELQKYGSGKIEFLQLDVQDQSNISRAYEKIREDYKHLDCLVNNAGILYDNGINDTSSKELMEVFRTNVMGPFMMAKQFAPLLIKSTNPKIINVTSQMGSLENSGGGFTAYRVSKTALNSLTRNLHHDFEGDGVKVFSVCPGWVHTDMGGPRAPRTPEQGASSILYPFYNEVDSGSYLQDGKALKW